MIYLVDMDGVLADFEQGFLNEWRAQHPNKMFIPLEKRTTFYTRDQYSPEFKELISLIYSKPGFYTNLSPIPGSLEAITELLNLKNEVFICTSPTSPLKTCTFEKYEWIENKLGSEWAKRAIFTKDKTLVRGNYLIDDKPIITGVMQSEWEHILYDRPYNQNIKNKRRLNWQNWKQVLNISQ